MMETKRFFAENSHVAFRLVKESLGADAVIISNRTLPDGVEIIAGDQVLMEASQDKQETADKKVPADGSGITQWEHLQKNTVDVQGQNSRELIELKQLIVSELTAVKVGSWESNDKDRYRVFSYLVRLGFGIQLVAKIVGLLDADNGYQQMRLDALQEIELSINTGPGFGQEVDELTGIIVLHGMTGAGKTATIAKIAAQVVATHGPEDVVMVCADNRRMGAHQQLLGYGKILEVPVLNVRRTAELDEILTALRGKRLVLVDNPGISTANLNKQESYTGFNSKLPNIRHFLALAATTQCSVINRFFTADWQTHLDSVIVTKADEAAQLGECISCLIQHHLPAAFISAGQNIRKDLERLHADVLVQHAVSLGDSMKVSEGSKVDTVVKTLLHDKFTSIH